MEAGLARGPEIRLARVATPTYRVYEADHSFRWVQQPGQGTPGRPPTHLDRPPTHARLLDCLARLRRGSRKLCVNDRTPWEGRCLFSVRHAHRRLWDVPHEFALNSNCHTTSVTGCDKN